VTDKVFSGPKDPQPLTTMILLQSCPYRGFSPWGNYESTRACPLLELIVVGDGDYG
jgi:hypothetical protein